MNRPFLFLAPWIAFLGFLIADWARAGDAGAMAVEIGKKIAMAPKLTDVVFKTYLSADEEVRKQLFNHSDAIPFNEENRINFCLAVLKYDKADASRLGAATWLSKAKDNRLALGKLADLLADKNPAIRAVALEGLTGYRGDPTLGVRFAKLLFDESSATRQAAARALGKLGDRKQTMNLIAAYKKFKTDGDEDAAIGEALALLGETSLSLDIAKVCMKSRSLPVRVAAINAIECNPSMKAIPIIMENLILELGRTVRLDSSKPNWDIVYVTMCSELVRRTGKNFDNDAIGWYRWWDGVREEYKAPAPAFDEAIVTRWMDTYRKMGPSKVQQ